MSVPVDGLLNLCSRNQAMMMTMELLADGMSLIPEKDIFPGKTYFFTCLLRSFLSEAL